MKTKETFFSNCLFEAIKAKLRNPSEVKVHIISPKLNDGTIHFYWYDESDQTIRQFTHEPNVKTTILFEGKISAYNIKLFESRLFSKMKSAGWSIERQRGYANKKGFHNTEPFSIKTNRGH